MDNGLYLTDLIDVEILQKIQDAFSDLTGIASITTDADGIAVTNGSNFSDFCMKYTRTSPLGCQRCEKCDKHGAEIALEKGASTTYFCHAGLVDFAAPIMAGDKLVGCFIGGQVLTDAPDIKKIINVAEEIGVDITEYLQALMKVHIVKKETIDKAADFLYTISNILSNIAYHKYQIYQANIEVEKAARMKSDFLANMSHEIRTPMNAVIGMAEMALREELPPAARDYINQIKDSGKTLLTIINDILDFSKIESGKMDINISEYEPMSIVHDVSNIIITRIGNKDVELIFDISPDIPYELLGDSIRLKQIIINLSNNAVKFTKAGQVLLKMEAVPTGNDTTELRVSITDTGIGIKKEDMGKLFRSFQQLDSKRNRNIEGTGLGLAISKQLLSLMNGDIGVESEYGVGSTFSFALPQKIIQNRPSIVIKNDTAITAAALVMNNYVKQQLRIDIERFGAACTELESDEELPIIVSENIQYFFVEHAMFSKKVETFIRNNPNITAILMVNFHTSINYNIPNLKIVKKPLYSLNIAAIFNHEEIHLGSSDNSDEDFEFIAPEAKVLIVDDNAINLTVAEGLLEPLKMNIETALSGEEAIGKISAKHYDLIFMDHMMPELDGVETTHIIRRFHSEYDDVPIIALTANAVDGTKEMFLKEGMNDFVAKPIELRIIVSKIKHWLPKDKIQKISNKQSDNTHTDNAPHIQIEGLDTDVALKLIGNEKLFFAVLKDYYKVIPKKLELIRQYEENEDWHAYTIEVHALKSASRQIGAMELAEKAALMEKAGNDKNADLIHSETAEMLERYEKYYDILKPYFTEDEPSSQKISINSEVLHQCFLNMESALDELDIDKIDEVISEMKKYSYSEEQQRLFTELENAADNIDVDSCTEILEKWKHLL